MLTLPALLRTTTCRATGCRATTGLPLTVWAGRVGWWFCGTPLGGRRRVGVCSFVGSKGLAVWDFLWPSILLTRYDIFPHAYISIAISLTKDRDTALGVWYVCCLWCCYRQLTVWVYKPLENIICMAPCIGLPSSSLCMQHITHALKKLKAGRAGRGMSLLLACACDIQNLASELRACAVANTLRGGRNEEVVPYTCSGGAVLSPSCSGT